MAETRYIRALVPFCHQGVSFEPGRTYALRNCGGLARYFCHPDLEWAEEAEADHGATIVGGLSLPSRLVFGDGPRRGAPLFPED